MTSQGNGTKLLTITELSSLIKVPVKTIRQWVYKAQIPNTKLNGILRFDLGDIETWIQESTRSK